MLPTFIVFMAIAGGIVLWAISNQRRLVVLDENISNAMSQIGVQLSIRFDALMALFKLPIRKRWDEHHFYRCEG